MLKISLVDGPRQRRMILEGALTAPWADELTAACETAGLDLDGRELIIDLRGVTEIGPDGESVLLGLIKAKIRLQCGVFARELLRQLIRNAQQSALGDGQPRSDTAPRSKGDKP
jgi:hypothetical protein